ncbi:hypothetical protein NLU13_1790 [Sarocladium strictum]|uniref:CENP-V/GFA domain-containing protein n=1 Tax=Sarocladium strictum TaxID=5046 RepID=A0AA39GSE0_SARSR|nr:hypothetical protein NLU13_1790 [Sarocladium strictum]
MANYASIPNLFPMQGGCPCGQTRFRLELPPLIVHCCHCTACQLQQGTAFALNAVIESHNLTLHPPPSPPPISDGRGGSSTPTSASAGIAGLVGSEYPPNLRRHGQVTGGVDQPTKPEVVTVPSASGAGQHIACCPSCRAGLWSYYADAGPILPYVRVGTLDRTQRRSIFTISDGKPQFEGYFPDRAAFYRDDAKERARAMEPRLKEWKDGMRKAFDM